MFKSFILSYARKDGRHTGHLLILNQYFTFESNKAFVFIHMVFFVWREH